MKSKLEIRKEKIKQRLEQARKETKRLKAAGKYTPYLDGAMEDLEFALKKVMKSGAIKDLEFAAKKLGYSDE